MNVPSFPKIRNSIVHLQVYLFVAIFAYEILGQLGFVNLSFENIATGIITPSHVHPSSIALVFLFGLYVIRPPYYQIENWKIFAYKFVCSILIVALATSIIEGSWDIVYLIKYYNNPNTGLITGVFGGMALMVEIFIPSMIFRIYKSFYVKRLLIGMGLMYIYYFAWLYIGFPTSGAPEYNSTLQVAIIETFHWIGGFSIFAWALKKTKKEDEL